MPYRRGDFKVTGAEGGGRAVERQVVGALGSIGAATLASRVLGYLRDMVVALAFGAGPVTDAFFVAFRIPNILRRLLGEGALSTAVVPVFTEYAATRSRPEFGRMLRAVLAGALMALAATTVLGVGTAPWLVRLVAPGFADDPGQLALAAWGAGEARTAGRVVDRVLSNGATDDLARVVGVAAASWARRGMLQRSADAARTLAAADPAEAPLAAICMAGIGDLRGAR